MFFCAHETKGYTLEEMDAVFDSGAPAWRRKLVASQLAHLEQQIRRESIVAPTISSSTRKDSSVFPLPTRHVEAVAIEVHNRDTWV